MTDVIERVPLEVMFVAVAVIVVVGVGKELCRGGGEAHYFIIFLNL